MSLCPCRTGLLTWAGWPPPNHNTFPSPPGPHGRLCVPLVLADFNGDGVPDVAIPFPGLILVVYLVDDPVKPFRTGPGATAEVWHNSTNVNIAYTADFPQAGK